MYIYIYIYLCNVIFCEIYINFLKKYLGNYPNWE